jgi:hypothetical protein
MTTGQKGFQEPFLAELMAATTRARTAARSCSGMAICCPPTRGGPARRLKITTQSRTISVWYNAVRLHHPVRGGQTPGHRPTVTRLSLAKVQLTVLSFLSGSAQRSTAIAINKCDLFWFNEVSGPIYLNFTLRWTQGSAGSGLA